KLLSRAIGSFFLNVLRTLEDHQKVTPGPSLSHKCSGTTVHHVIESNSQRVAFQLVNADALVTLRSVEKIDCFGHFARCKCVGALEPSAILEGPHFKVITIKKPPCRIKLGR